MPSVWTRGHVVGYADQPVPPRAFSNSQNATTDYVLTPKTRGITLSTGRANREYSPPPEERTQVALLEYRVTSLENRLAERDARERWMAGTLIALAAIVVSIVVPFLVTHP
jgi:hypothetical protein